MTCLCHLPEAAQSKEAMKTQQKRIIYLGEVLSHLEKLRCSVPATLIGGIVDRGFSQNDIDILDKDYSMTCQKIREALPEELAHYIHQVPEDEIGREAVPPKLEIGGPRFWDYVQEEPFYSDGFLNYSTRMSLRRLDITGKNILDVGCGDGYALSFMQSLGGFPIGISTAKENIRELREKGYKAYLMDQNCLDFPSQSFDIVFSHHTLEHSIAPVLAIREAYRVLIPGGIFDLTTGCSHNPQHYYILNKEFLESLLELSGFTMRECEMRRPGLAKEIHLNAIKSQGGLI